MHSGSGDRSHEHEFPGFCRCILHSLLIKTGTKLRLPVHFSSPTPALLHTAGKNRQRFIQLCQNLFQARALPLITHRLSAHRFDGSR